MNLQGGGVDVQIQLHGLLEAGDRRFSLQRPRRSYPRREPEEVLAQAALEPIDIDVQSRLKIISGPDGLEGELAPERSGRHGQPHLCMTYQEGMFLIFQGGFDGGWFTLGLHLHTAYHDKHIGCIERPGQGQSLQQAPHGELRCDVACDAHRPGGGRLGGVPPLRKQLGTCPARYPKVHGGSLGLLPVDHAC